MSAEAQALNIDEDFSLELHDKSSEQARDGGLEEDCFSDREMVRERERETVSVCVCTCVKALH